MNESHNNNYEKVIGGNIRGIKQYIKKVYTQNRIAKAM